MRIREYFEVLFSGDTLLEGLLVNGWLSKVVLARGHVEKSVAMWTFNLSEFVNYNFPFDTHEICFDAFTLLFVSGIFIK